MLHKALDNKLDMTIESLGRENFYKKLGNFEILLYLGTDLSFRIRKKTGFGVLFPSLYGG